MSVDLSESDLAAYFALRRAADRLQRTLERQLREHGLSEVQFAILARLAEGLSGIGMTALANDLVVTKGGLTYQARQLEGRGLVARSGSAHDERAVLIRLTDEGVRLLDAVMPRHVELLRELFIDRVSPSDLLVMRAALERVATPEATIAEC
ncbi:MAG: MarR family transcriptional regulator [Micropruina sp.]|uniref:MarR family winged helix-turn-helix transcriptional regulator n=1 Tax=Micropruina sp. TaxID=2737536 RepID=UPI0039E49F70